MSNLSIWKHIENSFKIKKGISTCRTLQLIHMDLFIPMKVYSFGSKNYALSVINDFTKYTWIVFLMHKDEALQVLSKFYNWIQNDKTKIIISKIKFRGWMKKAKSSIAEF